MFRGRIRGTARQSGLFADVIVSTDSGEIAEVAERRGAAVVVLRQSAIAGSTSPDILWVKQALEGRGEALPAGAGVPQATDRHVRL